MTPSPEFAVRSDPGVGGEHKGKIKYQGEMRRKHGDFLSSRGFDFPHNLFSEQFLLKKFSEGDFDDFSRRANIPKDKIIGGVIIPRVIDAGEISWRKALEIAIRAKSGEETFSEETTKEIGQFLRAFGVEEFVVKEDNRWEMVLNLRRKGAKRGEEIRVYSSDYSIEEKIADLTAIAMIPGETLRVFDDLILIYPNNEGYRSLLLTRTGEKTKGLRIFRYDSDLFSRGTGTWIYALDFSDGLQVLK